MKMSNGVKYCLGVCGALCALYLIGVADLDYGYYTFLRIASLIALVSLILVYWSETVNALNPVTIIGGVILILFNPIFPIYLDKEIWVVLDIISAVSMIGLGGYIFVKNKKQSGKNE